MKRILLLSSALVLSASVSAYAGGLAEPVMEPDVVAEATSSSSPGIVVALLLLLVIAAAASSGGGGGAGKVIIPPIVGPA